jgi:hypothetical protein
VPTIAVTAYDKSYEMRKKGDRANVFEGRTYNQIVREVGKRHGFRDADIQTPDQTTLRAKRFQQTGENDWEFLLAVAGEVGFELFVERGVLWFRSPRTGETVVPGTLAWRKNLRSFNPSLSLQGPVSRVIVRGWDAKRKKSFQVEVDGTAVRDVLGKQSAVEYIKGGDKTETVRVLDHVVAKSEEEARAIAVSYLRQKEYHLLTATGACVGDPALRAKRIVRIEGLGTTFSGSWYVSKVTHRFESGYLCEFEARRNAVSKVRSDVSADLSALQKQGYRIGGAGTLPGATQRSAA